MTTANGAADHADGGQVMSRVVVSEFVSLDGVMEDPGGAEGYKHGGWTFKFDRGPEGNKFKTDELFAADALLLGRVTYQGFAKAWPSIKDEVRAEIAKLKARTGGDLLVAGSATLAQTLIEHGLVDEYRLMVFPIILGSGKRLFREAKNATTLTLSDATKAGSGIVLLTYRAA